ncbi:MAG: glycoside hydrolase 100 family protein [Bacteroidota bacterium]
MIESAMSLLRQATTAYGILASVRDETNYRRIWSRDGVICGLAGLLAKEEQVREGLKQSILSLSRHQGPQGQLPSNVQLDEQGQLQQLSFGGLCGRVDTISWWIVGICQLLHRQPDEALRDSLASKVEKGLDLLTAWEFNGKGLVYVPQSGNWADEYILRGYVLFDQLLRLWALRTAAVVFDRPDWKEQAVTLTSLLDNNYWIDAHADDSLYHQHAYELAHAQSGPSRHWEAAFGPGGYIRYFDLLANALAILLDIGTAQQRSDVLAYTADLSGKMPLGLLPSFWEPIRKGTADWDLLQANYKYHFRNEVYEFQNGGIWPVFNAWWGMALVKAGERERAEDLLAGIGQANALGDNGFYECLHGQTGQVHGTRLCTWSAAGWILLDASLKGEELWFPSS